MLLREQTLDKMLFMGNFAERKLGGEVKSPLKFQFKKHRHLFTPASCLPHTDLGSVYG